MILIDSGPLVAMFNRTDEFHQWVQNQLTILKPPFYTCESVISDTCFKLQQVHADTHPLFELFEREVLFISFDFQVEHAAVNALMDKYSDLPMDLADACLVRMAERDEGAVVFTLDGDFLIYRKSTRHVIPTIMPENVQSLRRRRRR